MDCRSLTSRGGSLVWLEGKNEVVPVFWTQKGVFLR